MSPRENNQTRTENARATDALARSYSVGVCVALFGLVCLSACGSGAPMMVDESPADASMSDPGPSSDDRDVVASYAGDSDEMEAQLEDVLATLDPLARDLVCDDACRIRDNICELSLRICDISDRHPDFASVMTQCGDADQHCTDADERVLDACACEWEPPRGVPL